MQELSACSLFLSLLLLLLFLSPLHSSLSSHAGDATTTFIYAGCSQLKYTAGTPYEYNLNSLIASLANSAGFSLYANFTSSLASSSSSSPIYGLYQCRGDLPISSCESCIRSSINQLSNLCSSSCGGAIQLQGCFLRYGNESFLGRPDNTILYKKCGPGTATGGGGGYDNDLMGMRDSALTGLVGGAGFFRVSPAGYVDGTAQCVGDLTDKECTECVTYAVGTLRTDCGVAVSGEAYLGKCYAKYSSQGVYSKSDHGSSADATGKTLAMIVGLMAGVILIIVFLSFIRRTAGGDKGKF